jgi:hypothetical protein
MVFRSTGFSSLFAGFAFHALILRARKVTLDLSGADGETALFCEDFS